MLPTTEKLFRQEASLNFLNTIKGELYTVCIFLDIQGHRLTQAEFAAMTRKHPDAIERFFENVDDYVHMFVV